MHIVWILLGILVFIGYLIAAILNFIWENIAVIIAIVVAFVSIILFVENQRQTEAKEKKELLDIQNEIDEIDEELKR